MPIPRPPSGEWESVDQVDEAYKELGWRKEITFEWIGYNQSMRTWICGVFRANNAKFPCSCINSAEFVYLTLMPTGVMKTCAVCRVTSGPVSFNDDKGRPLVNMLSQRAVTQKHAIETVDRTGQIDPPNLRGDKTRLAHAKKLLDLRIEQR